MNSKKPGCRQQFSDKQLKEIKQVFHLESFEGLDKTNKHKNEYIWGKIRQKLSFPTLENKKRWENFFGVGIPTPLI